MFHGLLLSFYTGFNFHGQNCVSMNGKHETSLSVHLFY